MIGVWRGVTTWLTADRRAYTLPAMTVDRRRPTAKATPALVQSIRVEYAAGAAQSTLARRYQLSINTIGRIVRGETWQDLPDQPQAAGTAAEQAALKAEAAASLKKLLEQQSSPAPQAPLPVPVAVTGETDDGLTEAQRARLAQQLARYGHGRDSGKQ